MATLGVPNGPWADRYHSARSSITTHLQQLYHFRPRARPTRTLLLTATAFLLFIFLLSHSPTEPAVNYWLKYPSYRSSQDRPEDVQIVYKGRPALTRNDTLPGNLQKNNPSFHLVIPAKSKSPALCRMLTSAMILNYPPPTLINYGKKLPDGAKEYDVMRDRITGIYEFLDKTRHVQDNDFVLIADGTDFFFQLPPDVLIQRFQKLLKENNAKLQQKYGLVMVEKAFEQSPPETVQKYTQRVLFSASKECCPGLSRDAGCVAAPESSLPPDIYGWKTDRYPDGTLTRPRWIKPGAVIGQVADLKAIYAEILRLVEHNRNVQGDYVALTQLFGRQEYVRELERRRTSSPFMEWMYTQIGISEASNLTGLHPLLETGRRYEYGIGIDYESQLFFNMWNSKNDVEWLQYNNVSRTSSVQMQHGVPRERRLLLPEDLNPEQVGNPFTQSKVGKDEPLNPPYNATLDALPNPQHRSWHNLPLLTNIHSAAVPALVRLDGDPKLRDTWWSKMWYHPWARALLRKYVRSPSGFEAAQSALLGGQEWWDLRGGKGGVWTEKGEWIDYSEVCVGYERDLFNDGFGKWRKEDGGSDEPIYNQFGQLIKGKEE
ncbi:hypothetical protein BDV37DRAFT_105724 [Aspergillus pseudonomiae]|uniref:Uncharacterized protein n=1 Tax=Aspergillus pseudonomiae TaxID=1506151 RepID=A0A5N7DES1_9EURO|nr:uncharacterized protein BDV37DRAFT_105724 [Aspergillus pseudonomiae]KAE8404754.1 hypothetical protein BDV37DRAFT_105724 [Aspergillus pseudonomiae]